ncbi:MAG: peptidoglycan DD-metalloendopeptidase family protein [Alistipes sp.]|jgi:murein DD-endopeptidase MepM/ murein hydrolase activator NlpD|nr:peptidoglycan DD-metalloendopeptidase family protein [Alistipes sp.]MBQ1957422.1 peptidoglycan DD-metalloendopeptidase family protein [Alistipes sp.]MEE1103160.1 peptidoglycan DD-metalloendopeptidase family protein [Alistipes sp.]
MRRFINLLLISFLFLSTACQREKQVTQSPEPEVKKTILYGIEADDYQLKKDTIKLGQTLGKVLGQYGISAQRVDQLDKAAKEIFPLRQIRADRPYILFLRKDSLNLGKLDYFVYEKDVVEYVVFDFTQDSIAITKGEKPVTIKRQKRSSTIESSLWGAIMRDSLPYSLAAEMEEIYQWTVDFFGIQKGDNFTVIYDEKLIDSTHVGIGRIWGAKFNHAGKEVYAIPFKQGDKIQYWEYDGASLRKQLLKAPLKFSRISSGFSYSRLHPVHRVYRAHTGVDYAAPKGTPVRAVADGVVTFKGWGGGGGNTLKIKHAGNLVTGYLHLSKFAAGINKGSRVSQGQLIGYVGSTGTSTGPHLDYRIWKNGTPINPLKVPQEPAEPIKKENMAAFEILRERIVAELNGTATPDMIVTQLDSVEMPKIDTLKVENSKK